ncbi:SusC/RagA family TonB-linked outer membrane protein [Bacteroides clarus]|uniref:SusC/RagA family TonB-linked outer membrane protein n=1 Tax=Bacteroides clarus TaxID=626929 RepID=A0A1Y4JKJ2_9BACE|nr:SusC/RagA family TonB-linked outer membrane protein [Bacteroides clarus]OUP33023.1 SusC/RagA family TonB-linked outer membrane protein [Bacteroides clarus]
MNVKRTKWCLSRSFLVFIGLFVTMMASAQQFTVKGTVKDATGEPIIGANVMVKGTSNGTITDIDGNYSISGANSSSVLVFTFIGYKSQEVACKGQHEINVVLAEDSQTLDEVVVVGYGSLSKKELSSSIVQVDKSEFQQGAMNNPMEMLTGKVAGLNVNNTASANPNSGSSLQIRGATSITASNDPLIVIDGIAGGDIRNLSSQDIESMTVLKDAASAAIYGTRGANGVILITTKKGVSEPGTAKVTYDSWFGVNFANSGPDILSPDEFRRSRRGTDYGASTDWYGLLLRDFSYDNNQYISIDGSTKNGYYGASFNYKNATGIDLKSAREEYGGRFVIEQRVIDNRLQLNGSLNARRVNETWGNDGMFDTALSMNPTMPLYDDNGNYYQPSSPTDARNPVAELRDIDNNGQRMYVLGTAEAKLNILRSEKQTLNTSLSYSLHYNDLKQQYFTPSTSGESYWNGYKGRAEVTYQKWYTQRLEWLANYALDIQDHSIKAVAGYTYENTRWERLQASNNDFAYDNIKWHDLGSGSYLADGKAKMATGQSVAKLIGTFGRINYNWKDLIMASASIRYEGSTKFGKNHKWGAFPSASLAWEIANMNFMKNISKVVKSLKPRISYGVTGRSDFDSYLSLATYSTKGSYFMNGEWVKGYAPSVNANPELGWEKSVSVNVGIDFVLWNRLRGSIDWFDRQSKDLLYNYTAPQPPFVYNSILVNVGTTQNRGVELSIDGDIFKGTKVEWTSGINYSYGTTKLKTLSNSMYQASYVELYQKPGVGTSEYFFRVQEGGKVGQFYGYEYAGVEDGKMLIYTDEGEKVPVSEADVKYKRYIGNGTPTSFLSWNNTLRYKNFDLNIFFRGAFGFDIFNMRKYGMGLQGAGTDNVLRDAYLKDKDIVTGGGVISSFFLEKGDYFKLENVTLGYNFTPKPNKILNSMRVFVSAKNLFTLTGYSGNDPSVVSVNGLEPGVDSNSAYPTATQVSLGLTLRFK